MTTTRWPFDNDAPHDPNTFPCHCQDCRNRRADGMKRWARAATCATLVRRAFTEAGIAHRAEEAVRVMMCESGGNPSARNGSSSASGLFQQLATYWPGRAATYGMAGRSVFDPWANAVVSAGMVRDTGGWSHWSCRP